MNPSHTNNAVSLLKIYSLTVVILYHTMNDWVPNAGYIGVDIFFLLSGYLYGKNYTEIRNHADWLAGRLLRLLLPSVIILTVINSSLNLIIPQEYVTSMNKQADLALTGIFNNYLGITNQNYFDLDPRNSPTTHLWSINLELKWVIIFPFLMILARSQNIYLLWLVNFLIITAIPISSNTNISGYYSDLFRISEFTFGLLLAVTFFNKRVCYGNIVLICAWLILAIIFILPVPTAGSFPKFSNLLAILAGSVIIVLTDKNTFKSKSLFLRIVDRACLSIYLSHIFSLTVVYLFVRDPVAIIVLQVVGAFFFGLIFYWLFEYPSLLLVKSKFLPGKIICLVVIIGFIYQSGISRVGEYINDEFRLISPTDQAILFSKDNMSSLTSEIIIPSSCSIVTIGNSTSVAIATALKDDAILSKQCQSRLIRWGDYTNAKAFFAAAQTGFNCNTLNLNRKPIKCPTLATRLKSANIIVFTGFSIWEDFDAEEFTDLLAQLGTVNPHAKIFTMSSQIETTSTFGVHAQQRNLFRKAFDLEEFDRIQIREILKVSRNRLNFNNSAALASISATTNAFTHIDAKDQLCTFEWCYVMKNSKAVYWDQFHLTRYGATLATEELRREILTSLSVDSTDYLKFSSLNEEQKIWATSSHEGRPP